MLAVVAFIAAALVACVVVRWLLLRRFWRVVAINKDPIGTCVVVRRMGTTRHLSLRDSDALNFSVGDLLRSEPVIR